MRFNNLVAKRRKINDRVAPILEALRLNDVICLSRSEKVAEFAQCVQCSLPSEVVKTVKLHTESERLNLETFPISKVPLSRPARV